MKVVHVNDARQRDACLARLCAEVYGQESGIAPLVTFAGTLSALVGQEAARVFALVDDDARPVALALLVLDERGVSMEVSLLAALASADDTRAPVQRLVAALAERAPLRVNATSAEQEQMFCACGIERWFDGPDGVRIGLGPRHEATRLEEIPAPMRFDERAVIQAFKQDKSIFDGYKKRFIDGLAGFPKTL